MRTLFGASHAQALKPLTITKSRRHDLLRTHSSPRSPFFLSSNEETYHRFRGRLITGGKAGGVFTIDVADEEHGMLGRMLEGGGGGMDASRLNP